MDPDQVLAELREYSKGWHYATYTSAYELRRRPKSILTTAQQKPAKGSTRQWKSSTASNSRAEGCQPYPRSNRPKNERLE